MTAGQIDSLTLGLANSGEAEAIASVSIRQAIHLRDVGARDVRDTDLWQGEVTIPAGAKSIDLPLETSFSCDANAPVAVVVHSTSANVKWVLTPHEPPGTQSAVWDEELSYWRWIHGTLQFNIAPVSSPYSPVMVKSGVTRPETATNMWISDPSQELPQSLSIEWGEPVDIGSVQLTFDSQLSGWIWGRSIHNDSSPLSD